MPLGMVFTHALGVCRQRDFQRQGDAAGHLPRRGGWPAASPQALGSLIREPSFRRVRLGGLSKQDASWLVELSAGVTLSEPSLELIDNRTEGNPLFLSERSCRIMSSLGRKIFRVQ